MSKNEPPISDELLAEMRRGIATRDCDDHESVPTMYENDARAALRAVQPGTPDALALARYLAGPGRTVVRRHALEQVYELEGVLADTAPDGPGWNDVCRETVQRVAHALAAAEAERQAASLANIIGDLTDWKCGICNAQAGACSCEENVRDRGIRNIKTILTKGFRQFEQAGFEAARERAAGKLEGIGERRAADIVRAMQPDAAQAARCGGRDNHG